MRTKNKGNQDISKRNPSKYTINQIRGEGRTYNITDHGAKRKNCDFALMPQSNNRNNLVDFSTDEEKTEVIYGEENVTNWALQRLSTISNTLDLCGDRYGPSIIVANEPIMQKYTELHKRGVRQRSITEITPENIAYCKELMKFQELRHLDGLKGYLSIADGRIVSTHAFGGERGLPHAVESTVRIFVEQQQYFFETLWNKAIPADQKIMEIEEGIEPEVIETIRDPTATQARTIEMIKSAKEEVFVIFSTSNAFRRQEKAGALNLLVETAKSKNLKIRILSPVDDYVRNIIDKVKREDKIRIEIRNIGEPLRTKVSVLIIDRSSLLSAELKRDSKETSIEAIGLATYSNSKPTVLSYVSIFESLWDQTELYEQTSQLYEQLKSHDKMKQEFMDIAAHELRTPIQPILGLAQILKDQISDSTQTKFLDVILRNAKRLQRLQEDMLDVTRIESDSMKIYKESFNLNELIFNVLQDFNTQPKGDNRIKLNYKSDGDVWVVADKNRIIQVISNLLENSIKFTKTGKIWVELKKRKGEKMPNNNQVIISVKDEGPGIDSAMMPRLFSKFTSKSEKGTGLGLFISKSIIEAHGGEIWAKNNIASETKRRRRRGEIDNSSSGDGGATFSFSLQVKPPQKLENDMTP
jgi:two-component system, OmpR family, sensor histidine kinase VicK